jgi:hypothetical protein
MGPTPRAEVQRVVLRLTAGAMAKHNMMGLVRYFAAPAQERITHGRTFNQDFGQNLDNQIDKLAGMWKEKYGHEFDIRADTNPLACAFASIQFGVAASDKQLMAGYLAARGDAGANTAQGFGPRQCIALMGVKRGEGLPPLQISFLRGRDGSWELDVPDTTTASDLRYRLLTELRSIGDSPARLPDLEADGYREVAHHVLMAIMLPSPIKDANAQAARVFIGDTGAKLLRVTASVRSKVNVWWQQINDW